MGAPLLVVTPWFPVGTAGTPLEAAVARTVLAAAHAGADVTVVHLVAGATEAGAAANGSLHIPVRRVPVESGAVEDVAEALVDHAADLFGGAAVVHAHGGLPVAAALAMVLPEGVRLVVSEHLASLAPLLEGEPAPGAAAAVGDYALVLDRADVVLLPSEGLARAFVRRFRRDDARTPRVDVLPYLAPLDASPSPSPPPDAAAAGALPLVRWLLLGGADAAEPVVRALAADALAGAPTTLAVPTDDEAGDERLADLTDLAARLGVGDRVQACPLGDVLGRLAGAREAGRLDLVVGLDPLTAADAALPAAFTAGLPAILARPGGPEEVLDEVAATGGVRFVTPAPAGSAGVVALLEAVADLRLRRRASALPPWRASLDAGARRLARLYGEALEASETPAFSRRHRASPRVLLVDLTGSRRDAIGQLARWVVGIGGEAVVVTAGAPPPCSGLPGAVTVDLRPVERALARPPLARVRRRLPGAGGPALDAVVAAYRSVRPPPTLVQAALAGPLEDGIGRDRAFDAVMAGDADGAELARRWTGLREVLPADADALVRELMAVAASPSTLAPAEGAGGTERE